MAGEPSVRMSDVFAAVLLLVRCSNDPADDRKLDSLGGGASGPNKLVREVGPLPRVGSFEPFKGLLLLSFAVMAELGVLVKPSKGVTKTGDMVNEPGLVGVANPERAGDALFPLATLLKDSV
jgi:hypothetical protein